MPMLSSEINAASGAAAEFSARPRRRAFTAGDKLRILADVDRAAAVGGIGAALRRENLYSSTLSDWRRLRDAGAFGALTPARHGRKVNESPLTAKVALLQEDNARLLLRLIPTLLNIDPRPFTASD